MHGMEPAQGTCIADSNACVTAPSKSFEMKVSDIRHRLTGTGVCPDGLWFCFGSVFPKYAPNYPILEC